MRSVIVLLLAALWAVAGWAEAVPAAQKTYTLSFKNPPGAERQYACGINVRVKYEQLLNGWVSGEHWAGESRTARESVAANDNGTATLKYWVPEGTRNVKLPGKTFFTPLPT